MSVELEESRQQALIALMRAASRSGVDLLALVSRAEEDVASHTAEPYRGLITKQIRIAHAMTAGVLSSPPAE